MLVHTHVLFGLLEIMGTMCRMQMQRDIDTMTQFAATFEVDEEYTKCFSNHGFRVFENGRNLDGTSAGPYLGAAAMGISTSNKLYLV